MPRRRSNRSLQSRAATDVEPLAAKLEPLVRRLQELKAQAAALEIFTDDRELLCCPRCGLREDVAAGGLLFTYFESTCDQDSGLRFAETEDDSEFRCPSCGGSVRVPDEPR